MYFHTMALRSALGAVLALSVAACGGGGEAEAPQATAAAVELQGTVTSGSLAGAAIYLDLNNNKSQEVDEPVATAPTADGSFTLTVPATSVAELGSATLVATLPIAQPIPGQGEMVVRGGSISLEPTGSISVGPAAAWNSGALTLRPEPDQGSVRPPEAGEPSSSAEAAD